MWGRDSRVFDDYSENSFNNLYGFLCHAFENGNYTDWERAVAKKAKEKFDSYSAIAESSEEPGKLYVRIGWFGEGAPRPSKPFRLEFQAPRRRRKALRRAC